MGDIAALKDQVSERFAHSIQACHITLSELTVVLEAQAILSVCTALRDEEPFQFEQLIDLCAVDYLTYGQSEWQTDEATGSGFSRAVGLVDKNETMPCSGTRFVVVVHLLSITHNQRIRLCVMVDGEPPSMDSLTPIWSSANWYEREAFDLFGILFAGHPDLRRILTDYGFIGHPFRKDFPLSGEVEVRYDPEQQRVIYQPVSIEPRTLVPRVIRSDHRYTHETSSQTEGDK